MSRTLFWEEEVPGKTQLMAAIIGSYTTSKVTYYEIELKVSTVSYDTGETDTRTWIVKRRYSAFLDLHVALIDLGFPCPELPPKQLWGGHTSTFMLNRQNALNCWIQGVVIIWQSAAPARPRVAYAIGELLEAFLCALDAETFYKTLEEVQNEEKTAIDTDFGFEAASLPRLEPGIQPTEVPHSPFVRHESSNSPNDDNSKTRTASWPPQQAVLDHPTFAQMARNGRRSKRKSATNPILEDHISALASSLSEWPGVASFPEVSDKIISQSAPDGPHSSFLDDFAPPLVPSAGAIGIAIDMRSSPSSIKNATEYVTFNNYGQRVKQSFLPFTAKVAYGQGPEGREEVARTSGMLNAATPVSVPPTPHALTQFNAQWNQYTSSVLEFVQERLSIVSQKRDFNILDRHYNGPERSNPNLSDEEDGEQVNSMNPSVKPMLIINLRTKAPKSKHHQSDASEPVEDADAGAGGSASAQAGPPNSSSVQSYVIAGEHLINTILKEAEADIMDWQFVSNTKDVIVMRRLRPIKKKNLLKLRGPSVHQPSPSPQLNDDRNRGMVVSAPSALVLDGASSTASSAAFSKDPMVNVEQSQHCFMGRGVIEASAEEIFDLVRRPEKRHLYDAMLNEELLLENFAVGEHAYEIEKTKMGNLLVYYHLFETNRCFLRYARDFCVLQYAKKVKVGRQVKYVVVGASINHPKCPVRLDVERATLDLFGWVVEPTQKPKQSKVTYMMHIDFGRSGVPTHLLNTISFRQPLAVHYLRRHIQSIPPEERSQASKENKEKELAAAN